jgi:hypothetical protein
LNAEPQKAPVAVEGHLGVEDGDRGKIGLGERDAAETFGLCTDQAKCPR